MLATLELTVTNGGDGATLHRMLKAWRDTDTWTTLGGTGLRPRLEVVATVDASTFGTFTPERIVVTPSLAAWSSAPCDEQGWALLPRGTDGWDFVAAEGADPPSLSVEFKLPGTPVVAANSLWTYWKGTSEPPAGWNTPDFEPGAGWLVGPAGIGYGDGDDATVLDDMRGEYLSIFVRHAFEVVANEAAAAIHLTLICDDGAVLHLNGVELGRDNMPAGEVTSATRAVATLEARTSTFRLPPGSLRVGRNVVAASVHNADVTSSDFSFSAVLLALSGVANSAPCVGEFQRGDATSDGQVNLTDAVRILDFLFRGGLVPVCLDAADADDDGKLLLTDAVRVLATLFQGAGPLPPPGSVCGVDPSTDVFPACESLVCAP